MSAIFDLFKEKPSLNCCKGCSNVLQKISHLVEAFTYQQFTFS